MVASGSTSSEADAIFGARYDDIQADGFASSHAPQRRHPVIDAQSRSAVGYLQKVAASPFFVVLLAVVFYIDTILSYWRRFQFARSLG